MKSEKDKKQENTPVLTAFVANRAQNLFNLVLPV
jgi:hypothetical protein